MSGGCQVDIIRHYAIHRERSGHPQGKMHKKEVTPLCRATSVFADNVIQTDFFGNKLGGTSRADFLMKMSLLGAKVTDYNDAAISFSGDFELNDYHFSTLNAVFLKDTLCSVMFLDSVLIDKILPASNFKASLKSKYQSIAKTAKDDFLMTMMVDSLQRQSELDSTQIWSRVDDKTAVILLDGDTGFGVMYIDQIAMWSQMVDAFADAFGGVGPDFDEANAVKGVAGVKFGDDIATVRKAISPKAKMLIDSDSHTLMYRDIKVGGMTYDFGTFYFAQGKGLVAVNFQDAFYSWKKEEAMMAYEGVISSYQRKYSNLKVVKDDTDDKLATCGAYDKDYDYPPIVISLNKSLSKGGDIMYYVMVSYYEMKRSTLFDDEI